MTETNKIENTMEAAMQLNELDMEALASKAAEVGVEPVEDKSEMVEAIVAAMESDNQEDEEVAGHLISLRTTYEDKEKTARAQELIRRARDKIFTNQKGNHMFTLFRKNKAGSIFTTRAPGVRLTQNNIERVLELVADYGDDNDTELQNEVIADFRATPENFDDALLVYVRRANGNGGSVGYVMMYLSRKVDIPETVF